MKKKSAQQTEHQQYDLSRAESKKRPSAAKVQEMIHLKRELKGEYLWGGVPNEEGQKNMGNEASPAVCRQES